MGPPKGFIEAEKLELFDAVFNFAGDNIASGRWTRAKKERLRSSRIQSTELLAQSLSKQSYPPKVFVCASAIGIYSECGDSLIDEDQSPGKGFLAGLCKEWEETAHLFTAGRVVTARCGIVLSQLGLPAP